MLKFNQESTIDESVISTAVKKAIPIRYVTIDKPFEVAGNNGAVDYGKPGDKLMIGVKGELYICPKDVFEASYETSLQDQEVSDEKMIQLFISKPENKANAIKMAGEIHKETSGNWFNLEKICKKMNLDPRTAFEKLQMLALFDLSASKPNKDKTDNLFKITLTNADRRSFLEQMLRENIAEKLLIEADMEKYKL